MRVLYATDGSEGALAGARLLNALPLDAGSEIRILTVIQHEEETVEGERALGAARAELTGSPARVAADIRRGNAAEEILDAISWAAEGEPADLVVVGTRGRSPVARFFVGSVAERVARHAPRPVLLARPLRRELDRVIVGVDSSECSEQAARWLASFPLPRPCEVQLVTVATPIETLVSSRAALVPHLGEHLAALVQQERDAAEERLAALSASFTAEAAGDVSVVTEVRSDDPAQGLLAAAEERSADLVAVGSHGVSGIDRFLIGSVSEKILRHAPCSVLVVKKPAAG